MTRRRPPGHTTAEGYGWAHQAARVRVLAGGPTCHRCGAPATQLDHVPPLDLVALALGLTRLEAGALYVEGLEGDYRLLPACGPCNRATGRRYQDLKRGAGLPPALTHRDLNRSRAW